MSKNSKFLNYRVENIYLLFNTLIPKRNLQKCNTSRIIFYSIVVKIENRYPHPMYSKTIVKTNNKLSDFLIKLAWCGRNEMKKRVFIKFLSS